MLTEIAGSRLLRTDLMSNITSHSCPSKSQYVGEAVFLKLAMSPAGEATASKTQLCLQLLLSVQWPKDRGGLEGSAL